MLGTVKLRECSAAEYSEEAWVKSPCVHWYEAPVSLGDIKNQLGTGVTISGSTPVTGVGIGSTALTGASASAAALKNCKLFLGLSADYKNLQKIRSSFQKEDTDGYANR